MANYTTYSDFYKVSFITTKSINIPKLLKQTGGLIIMSNEDDIRCTVNPDHGVHNPKSLWFRGDMIASGYGALCQEERDNLTYLAGTYTSLFTGIDQELTDISTWLNTYYGEFQNAMSYAYGEIDRVKQESYSYSSLQIKNLIGCAPDYLDTLGEIAHWLEYNKEIGMDTIKHVKNIANSYVWYNDEVEASYWNTKTPVDTSLVKNYNKYAYIGEYGWDVEPNIVYYAPGHKDNTEGAVLVKDNNGNYIVKVQERDAEGNLIFSYDNAGNLIPVYKQCSYDPGNVTDSFESFKTVYSGIIAMKDYQTSTHYAYNPTLADILDCIIEPYPYTAPNVELIECLPAYAEVGEMITVTSYYRYSVNDAQSISKINNKFVNYAYNTSGIHVENIPNISINSIGINHIPYDITYTYAYGPAVQQYYPQLIRKGIPQLCDDGKWINSGIGNGIFDAKVYGLLKVYGNALTPGNLNNVPNSKGEIKSGNSEFIYDYGNDVVRINMGKFEFNESHNVVWFAIPTSIYEYRAYIRNIHSNIMNPLNIKNTSDIFTFYTQATNISWHDNIKYSVYYVINNRSTMANDYELIIDLKKK